MVDASFKDGAPKAIRLVARDTEDLKVLSAMVQDAVFPADQMRWDATKRRFAVLLNRFRWEDGSAMPVRVQSVLSIEDVIKVQSSGVSRESDTVLSLLSIEWLAAEDGTGRLELVLAGDGAVALKVECMEVLLRDVTQAYHAPSGKRPVHPH